MLAHFRQKHGRRPDRVELILPILPQVGDSGSAAQALEARRAPTP
jgi:alkanesulfonate monooxygenase SsuD/methylene tetrahydromethanopterin reductase-like flavin-dependent oxidoreductase (luciferase family)